MKLCLRTSYLALALVACVALLWPAASQAVQKDPKGKGKEKVYEVGGGDGLKIEGKLADSDKKDKEKTDSYSKTYLVKLKSGKKYTIRMNSADEQLLDSFLRVEDAAGKQLAFNDDAPGEMTLNARVDFSPEKDGTYRIIATSFAPNQTGDYTVLIKSE